MDKPLLYRAALRGTFGEWIQFGRGGEIVSSASSFISLDREIEMDLFTAEAHRGKNLAAACAAQMLRDCMDRGITVHWDAQNGISRHLADKFGFEPEAEYSVYWLPEE